MSTAQTVTLGGLAAATIGFMVVLLGHVGGLRSPAKYWRAARHTIRDDWRRMAEERRVARWARAQRDLDRRSGR